MTRPRMTNAEAVLLCRYAKAACPQQAFDQYTPDAWFDLLEDLRFEDCKLGLRTVVKSQPFVSPAEIRTAVKRIRVRRLEAYGAIPEPPVGLSEAPEAYHAWHRGILEAIMDGEVTAEHNLDQAQLTARVMPDFASLLPSPPQAPKSLGDDSATRSRKIAETREALARNRPSTMPADLSDPHRERCGNGCVRGTGHTGPHDEPADAEPDPRNRGDVADAGAVAGANGEAA